MDVSRIPSPVDWLLPYANEAFLIHTPNPGITNRNTQVKKDANLNAINIEKADLSGVPRAPGQRGSGVGRDDVRPGGDQCLAEGEHQSQRFGFLPAGAVGVFHRDLLRAAYAAWPKKLPLAHVPRLSFVVQAALDEQAWSGSSS